MEECKICGNTDNNTTVVAREMMFGLRDEFKYLECGKCGCLQIKEIPANIAKYYPENYYSYLGKSEDQLIQNSLSKSLKRNLKKKLLNYYLHGNSLTGKLIFSNYKSYYPWIKKNTLTNDSKILDVGCGSGELLLEMYNDGFKDLTGVDPYIEHEINYKCGITIYKKQLEDLAEKYDLIMLHHAFEHMDQPLAILKKMFHLLNNKGFVLIRIPVAACFAWRKYGVNWVQLDPPRHFFLHTTKSMQILCEQSGFRLMDVVYDSYSLQFTGSEQYLRNIPLMEDVQLFTEKEIGEFTNEANRLNKIKDGDAACFYLFKE
jgi:SAM-dependent methyltransferase